MLEKQYSDIKVAGAYNVGPDEIDCISTGELVTLFCKEWNESETTGHTVKWKSGVEKNAPHEAVFLRLDSSKLKSVFGWKLRWHIEKAIQETIYFTRALLFEQDVSEEMDREISAFLNM